MASPIVLRLVDKTYESGGSVQRALNSINLEIEEGEVTLLMGPSGSGKTTLLSIIGSIVRPTAGSVTICGIEIQSLSEEDRSVVRLSHIGFVFQTYNLFSALTAGQNVAIALELKGITGGSQRAEARRLLDAVGIADRESSFPANLSGGQKQRVAIARALAGMPSIILADEPTAALDWGTGRQVLGILRELAHAQSRTVLIVTHDARAADFADRTIYMKDGSVIEEFKNQPTPIATHPLTARPPILYQASQGVPFRHSSLEGCQ